MVAFFPRQRLNLPVAPLAGAVLGLFTALLFALMPAMFLENLAIDSGIAAVLPAAEPPLGFTARAVLILLGGGSVAVVGWFALFLLLGGRAISVALRPSAVTDDIPVLRRADAHPDAPPRRPLSANRDLGTPFLDAHAVRRAGAEAPPVIQPLPHDLDLPLAAFDPAAMRDEPADWFPPPAPLPRTPRRQIFDASERFETFPLPGAVAPVEQPYAPIGAPSADPVITVAITPAMPIARPRPADFDGPASIHALLDRLERGVGQRETTTEPPVPVPTPREESLEDALTALRRLATRG